MKKLETKRVQAGYVPKSGEPRITPMYNRQPITGSYGMILPPIASISGLWQTI